MTSPREFPDSPVVVDNLGDPATDPFLTAVRMAPPDTQSRRLDPYTPRAVKIDDSNMPWVLVGDGSWLTNDVVAHWPLQDPITVAVAMDRGAGITPPPPASRPVELVGDLGVESFKGDTK